MRKLFIGFAILIVATSLNALKISDLGIKGGFGTSFLYGSNTDYDLSYRIYRIDSLLITHLQDFYSIKSDISNITIPQFSQIVGIYTNINISKGDYYFNFNPEIQWSRNISKFEFNNPSISISPDLLDSIPQLNTISGYNVVTINSIRIPLLFQIENPVTKTYSVFIDFGPSFGVIISSSNNYSEGIKNVEDILDNYVYELSQSDTLSTYSISRIKNSTDNLTSFDIGFDFGIGIKIKNVLKIGIPPDFLTFNIRFNLGLTNICNDVDMKEMKTFSSYFTIGYKF